MFNDPEVFQITGLSLRISALATVISLMLGLPLGTLLGLGRFPGRAFFLSLMNTGMGLPPVVVGLAVAMSLWRSGPLGDWQLIYTPAAIVIAQVIIAFPVATGLTAVALQALDPRLQLQLIGTRRLAPADDLAALARGAAAAPGRPHGRIRVGDLRGRRLDDGGRQHPLPDPRVDDRDRP